MDFEFSWNLKLWNQLYFTFESAQQNRDNESHQKGHCKDLGSWRDESQKSLENWISSLNVL